MTRIITLSAYYSMISSDLDITI